MKKEIQNDLFLIATFASLSFITGFFITFNNDGTLIKKGLLENLFLFCTFSLVIFFVLLLFHFYSLKFSNSTHPSLLFTRIKALTVLSLVLFFSLIWLNYDLIPLITITKETIISAASQILALIILISIIFVLLALDNQTEVNNQKKEILNQRQFLRKRNGSTNYMENENVGDTENEKSGQNLTPERKKLEESNVRPYSFLPPSIIPYGLRTVFNYPIELFKGNIEDNCQNIKFIRFEFEEKNKNQSQTRQSTRETKAKRSQKDANNANNEGLMSLQKGTKNIYSFMRKQEIQKRENDKKQQEEERRRKEKESEEREKREEKRRQEKKNEQKAETPKFQYGQSAKNSQSGQDSQPKFQFSQSAKNSQSGQDSQPKFQFSQSAKNSQSGQDSQPKFQFSQNAKNSQSGQDSQPKFQFSQSAKNSQSGQDSQPIKLI